MNRLWLLIACALILGVFFITNQDTKKLFSDQNQTSNQEEVQGGLGPATPHQLSIESLRNGEYPGSDIVIEQTLESGTNYQRFIVSYKSEGLKIYGLLTIPNEGPSPRLGPAEDDTGKYPAIVFNHGYIPPAEYRTTERYVAYVDYFARNGYIVFKPDYRGHGNSEGTASGGYGSNAYTIDVLNAVSSIKRLKKSSFWQSANWRSVQNLEDDPGQARMTEVAIVDENRIGMWGHSMGGFITLRAMVVYKDIKAGVIWAGVVGSHSDLLNNWRRRTITPTQPLPTGARRWRQQLIDEFGTPEQNPEFWNSISANSFLADISGPVQLHHGTLDASVPLSFSEKLKDQLEEAKKEVELYTYPGDDHDISANFGTAMQRSLEFFDGYVKNGAE